jgi:hypothetical protein
VIPSSTSPYHYDWAEMDPEGENNHLDSPQKREKIDPDHPPIGPYFDYDYFRNETVMVADTAYLKCRVKNIGNKTVSWVRHLDINLLSVGQTMYTSDNRFQAMHDSDTEEWTLKVSHMVLIQFLCDSSCVIFSKEKKNSAIFAQFIILDN